MNLVIIEGSGKRGTIQKYLGNDYRIIATGGHLRDLDHKYNNGYGFDFETLKPKWQVVETNIKNQKQKIIHEINKAAKDAQNIYIATDPDREGEAIAWHVKEVIEKPYHNKIKRVTFNEITKVAVLNAIANPRDIDTKIVDSQFARRLYDRYFGFKASTLVRAAVTGAKSAGRVQSVVLTILKNRLDEIANFKPETHYEISAKMDEYLTIKLLDGSGQSVNKFTDFEEASDVLKNLTNDFVLVNKKEKFTLKKPAKPFETSEFQKIIGKKLKLNPKEIETILQAFYQGVEIDGENQALSTYPRTDSTIISDTFIEKANQYVQANFSKEYWNTSAWFNEIKLSKNAQAGHEALRVIDLENTPELVKPWLSETQYQVYKELYNNTLALFLSFSKYANSYFWFENEGEVFYGTVNKRVFDGWEIINETQSKNKTITDYELEETYQPQQPTKVNDVTTTPPTLFTQADLIDYLKKKGIGRPSTFVTMAETNINNKYVELNKKKQMILTDIGAKLATYETENLNKLINENFTSDMETTLDEIAKGNIKWKDYVINNIKVIDEVISPLSSVVQKYRYEVEEADFACEKCGATVFQKKKSDGSPYYQCANYKWDPKKKKNVGSCSFVRWE
ncbi:DNA topoisomerase [Candidatus Mycoplasma pogonae]